MDTRTWPTRPGRCSPGWRTRSLRVVHTSDGGRRSPQLRFLIELPDAHRRVLILHDLQGYTDPEIARMLGLSLENVKIRLHRARVRLRAALSDGCDFSRDERGVFVCEPKPS